MGDAGAGLGERLVRVCFDGLVSHRGLWTAAGVASPTNLACLSNSCRAAKSEVIIKVRTEVDRTCEIACLAVAHRRRQNDALANWIADVET